MTTPAIVLGMTFIMMMFQGGISSLGAAQDCGEVPFDKPVIPSGDTATREEIAEARSAVIDFSNRIDDYITCTEKRTEPLLPYMTKDQQERLAEDLNRLASERTDLQIGINKEIRAWRERQDSETETNGKPQ